MLLLSCQPLLSSLCLYCRSQAGAPGRGGPFFFFGGATLKKQTKTTGCVLRVLHCQHGVALREWHSALLWWDELMGRCEGTMGGGGDLKEHASMDSDLLFAHGMQGKAACPHVSQCRPTRTRRMWLPGAFQDKWRQDTVWLRRSMCAHPTTKGGGVCDWEFPSNVNIILKPLLFWVLFLMPLCIERMD